MNKCITSLPKNTC